MAETDLKMANEAAPVPPWRRQPKGEIPPSETTGPVEPAPDASAEAAQEEGERVLLAVPTAARASAHAAERLAEPILDRSAPWIASKPPRPGGGPEPRYLEMVNSNPRDERLDFDMASHTYFLDGRALSGSVTALASSMSEDFDGPAVIQAMRAGRAQAWPRLRYAVGTSPIDLASLEPGAGGLLLEERPTNRTRAAMSAEEVAALFTHWGNDVSRWRLALQEELLNRACLTAGQGPPTSIGPELQLWTFEREMTEEEILRQWQQNGQEAADRGTEAHYQIELWLNLDGCRLEEIEVQHSLHFMALLAQSRAKAYRTEWRIFAEEEDLAGSVDFVARLPDGPLVLIDWKRSDKLEKGLRNSFRRMKAPLDHLDDCKGATYALQLNLYRFILEKYYGEQVAKMILVSVHPEAPFATAVPDLSLEVSYLMALRRARRQAEMKVESQAPANLRCKASGQLLTSPVLIGETCFQRACARRLLRQSEVDLPRPSDVKEAVESMVASFLPEDAGRAERQALLQQRIDWEDLMPMNGLAFCPAG